MCFLDSGVILEIPERFINTTFHKQVEEYEQKLHQPFLKLYPVLATVYVTCH